MNGLKRILGGLLIFLLIGCDELGGRALPFPTPAQHDLVVLTHPGPLTYSPDDDGSDEISGLEHDLTEAFARELGVGVKYIVVPPDKIETQLASGGYHIAAAWLSPRIDPGIQASSPIFQTRDILAQHEASLPLRELSQLSGKTVHVMSGSRQAVTMKRLADKISGLKIVEVGQGDILDLLETLGDGEVKYVAMDAKLEDIANQFVPELRTSLSLSDELPIVWLLGPKPNPELAVRANAFIERIRRDGTLVQLEERYFGHVRRLKQSDVIRFLSEIESTLPKLRNLFLAAESATGIDWRLIASVAYHESHWDANATSPTNVRGIMMLTEETADRFKVSNRLDPRESILAGARYLDILKDALPDEVLEPDRTWLALAAYNIGPGHFNAAQRIARQQKANPNAWHEMKRVLPLLAQPKYYERLKSGRARGGEAVILVENIRSYYDIICRHEAPYATLAQRVASAQGKVPGLKLKR
jgi:membrane-bound lytic murein transglycosylase F